MVAASILAIACWVALCELDEIIRVAHICADALER